MLRLVRLVYMQQDIVLPFLKQQLSPLIAHFSILGITGQQGKVALSRGSGRLGSRHACVALGRCGALCRATEQQIDAGAAPCPTGGAHAPLPAPGAGRAADLKPSSAGQHNCVKLLLIAANLHVLPPRHG